MLARPGICRPGLYVILKPYAESSAAYLRNFVLLEFLHVKIGISALWSVYMVNSVVSKKELKYLTAVIIASAFNIETERIFRIFF